MPPLLIEIDDKPAVVTAIKRHVLRQYDLTICHKAYGQIWNNGKWLNIKHVVEAKIISQTNANDGGPHLPGQIGVFAKENIPKNTAIGLYEGVMSTQEQFDYCYAHTDKYAHYYSFLYNKISQNGDVICVDAATLLPRNRNEWCHMDCLQWFYSAMINDGHIDIHRYSQ